MTMAKKSSSGRNGNTTRLRDSGSWILGGAELIPTKNPNFFLRFATPDDAGLVVGFMKKLGSYQKMADKIIATEAGIRKLLTEGKGESVFGIYEGEVVAFFYFCQTSSAFTGQSGLYMDGFYVDDAYRSHGFGKIMMAFLSKLAVERGCQRLEWGCLDWNEPSINFYKSLGAYGVDNMTIYRFSPDTLRENALRF
jgi:GNAT superfamily N-acetyltransferase